MERKVAKDTKNSPLDEIDHVAVAVQDVQEAVDWYTAKFQCRVSYQDDSWAFIDFANIKLALVVPHQHPPHIALLRQEAEKFGKLKSHRDGTKSVYIADPSGNAVEIQEK